MTPPEILAPTVSLDGVRDGALDAMDEAGREVADCQRVLAKTGDTVVGELLRGHGSPRPWQHYPPGDVFDPETRAQYYYHLHADDQRTAGDHGHFHTFLRPLGTPAGSRPNGGAAGAGDGAGDALSHLVAIAMDGGGRPVGLFTTNRWVTGEVWYAADEVAAMIDSFVVDLARPSWPTNRWITGMLCLFRPQIAALLDARDAVVARAARRRPLAEVLEDRSLEVLSQVPIDVDAQRLAVERERRVRRRAAAPARRPAAEPGEVPATQGDGIAR